MSQTKRMLEDLSVKMGYGGEINNKVMKAFEHGDHIREIDEEERFKKTSKKVHKRGNYVN